MCLETQHKQRRVYTNPHRSYGRRYEIYGRHVMIIFDGIHQYLLPVVTVLGAWDILKCCVWGLMSFMCTPVLTDKDNWWTYIHYVRELVRFKDNIYRGTCMKVLLEPKEIIIAYTEIYFNDVYMMEAHGYHP